MSAATPLSPGGEILVLEDDGALRKRLAYYLTQRGAVVSEAATLNEGRRLIVAGRFEFAAVDLHLPDGNALQLLRDNLFSENTGIVVMTAFGAISDAVEAMRLGAGDYLTKPFEPDQLPLAFQRCRSARRVARREEHAVGQTDAHARSFYFGASLAGVRAQADAILAAAQRLERRLPPLLIEGETGTGKSVFAHWLQQHGPRRDCPFVAVNCAALADSLIESELFGHERGAFTDAKSARLGLFEAADGGTLFLDEVGLLSLPTQAKLLTAVEEGTIRRLGGTREIAVDVQVIAASNYPLRSLVQEGAFRDELFQRLNLLAITLPPLRERPGDILPLARHLIAHIAAQHRLKNVTLAPVGEARLLAHPWPGNVRELSHAIERAIIFGGGAPLEFNEFADAPAPDARAWRNPAWRVPAAGFSLDAMVDELIAEVLRDEEGNVSAAARRLGVTRDFLRYRLGERRSGSAANG